MVRSDQIEAGIPAVSAKWGERLQPRAALRAAAQPFQPARREAAAERARARAAGRAGPRQRELKGGRQRLRSQAPQRNSWKGISGAGAITRSCFSFQTRLR